MNIPTLNSVTKLKPEDVIPTKGSCPVKVLCDDLEYYLVKYQSRKWDRNLLREYLGAFFLKLWGLKIPEFAFVKVKLEHIPSGLHSRIQPHYFNYTCFGLKYGKYLTLITKLFEGISNYQKSLIVNKNELLQIALFDIWISNEDRNENNYNLLYDVENHFQFVPIDHEAIFNQEEIGRKLTLLTESESLIGSPVFYKLFSKQEITKYLDSDEVENKFYLCVRNCHEHLGEIVDNIPDDWEVNKNELVQNLRNSIFQEDWLQVVWRTYLEYTQVAIMNKK